jgi:methyl-accepting chemotaxis protein
LVRRRAREDALVRLEEGFEKVVTLCDALNVHFTLQEERSAQIADSLRQVAVDMSSLAHSVGRQSETLEAIVGHLESGNHRTARVEELCTHFSKLTETQRQSLAIVSQQVENARRTDEEITQSLRTFQESMSTLGRSCAESTDTLRQMRGEASARDDRLAAMMEHEGKRFLLLFGVTLAVALAGIAGILISALR